MAGELVVMSTQELDRLGVIRRVLERRLTRVKAGHVLGLSARQVARLCDAYERDGAAGLASRKRGRSSNRKLSSTIETQVVELVRAHYDDFGPTLVREEAAGTPRHQDLCRDRAEDLAQGWDLAAP
jgi:transposase